MNTPPRKESETGLYAPVWRKINQMLDYMREISVVNGRDVRVSRTMNGTLLLGSAKGEKGATGTPSWKGEWTYWELPENLGAGESARPRAYLEGDMVIRGGEQVLDDAGNPLLIDGSVCGTWIARRAMSLGEAPGVPTAEETAANVFDWDLVARFANPTFVTKRGTKRITLGATPANVSIYLADSGLSTLASTVQGSVNISLVDAGGHNVQLRELNVCQNGVMRKMIILASEIYD